MYARFELFARFRIFENDFPEAFTFLLRYEFMDDVVGVNRCNAQLVQIMRKEGFA